MIELIQPCKSYTQNHQTIFGNSLEDAIYITVNEEHQFWNYGSQPLAFICIVPKGTEKKL